MNDWTIPRRVELPDVVEAFELSKIGTDGEREAKDLFLKFLTKAQADDVERLIQNANAFVAAFLELDRIGYDFGNETRDNLIEYALAGAVRRISEKLEWGGSRRISPEGYSNLFAILFTLACNYKDKQ